MPFAFLGTGFNTLNGVTCNRVVEIEPREGSYQTNVKVKVATSEEEIRQNLNIDATVGMKSTKTEVEAKLKFVKTLSSEAKAVTVLVIATKSQRAEVDSAKFKPSFLENRNVTVENLYNEGGDSYICEVEEGAYFYGAYQFQLKNSSNEESIKAELKSKFGGTAKVDAKFAAEIDNSKRNSSTTFSFEYLSSGFKQDPPDKKDLEKYLKTFSNAKLDGPVILSYKSRSYISVPSCPPEFKNVQEYIEAYTKPKTGWYANSLAVIETQAAITLNRVKLCLDLYRFYRAEGAGSTLQKNIDKLNSTREAILAWKSAFNPNGTVKPQKPNIDLSCFSNPSPNFRLHPGKLCGRENGGGPFCDISSDMIYLFVYPKTWKGRGGLVIENLEVTYAFRNPRQLHDEQSETKWSVKHGDGSGGEAFSQMEQFQPGDIWWTGIWLHDSNDGRYRDMVSGFEVKRRPHQDQPYQWGKNTNKFHGEFEPGPNATFVGWAGRQGGGLDALQMVSVKFEEAHWDDVQFPTEN